MSDFPEFISTSNDIDLLNIYKIVKFKFFYKYSSNFLNKNSSQY